MGGLIHLRITPKAYSLAFAENTENQNLTDTGCDEDRKLRDPTVAVAARRQRQQPVRGRDEPGRAPDSANTRRSCSRGTVTRTQRPEYYGRARRTMGEIAMR